MKKLVIVSLLLLSACTTVEPGHVGIVINQWGSAKGVSEIPTTTGFTFYNPVSTTVYTYPTSVQNAVWTASKAEGNPVNEEITFTNKDNMSVSVDVSVSYSLEAGEVPAFYVKFRNDDLNLFTHGFLRNITRDAFNETGGRYSIDQIMGDNGPFLKEVRDKIQAQVADIGVHLEQFGIIGAPRPPGPVTKAINDKLQATQIAIQKENEVRQAEADAKKSVAKAQGDSDSMVKRAEGEARANQLKAQNITPAILEWEHIQVTKDWVNKWDGKQPQTMLGSNSSPLITLPSK